jgi:hypothetical protein
VNTDPARAEGRVLAECGVLAECSMLAEGRGPGDAAEHPDSASATHTDATEIIDPFAGI